MPNDWSRRRFMVRTAAGLGAALGFGPLEPCRAAPDREAGFRPRLAICNETFRGWPFDRAFAFAAQCGYQGIEIAPFTISNVVTDIPARRRAEILRQAESAGLAVVGLHWLLARTRGYHLTSPDRQVRRKTAGYLGALAQFCADLGGGLLVFGSPKQRNRLPGVRPDEAMRYAAQVIRDALPALEKADVQLALEPLSPKATNFLCTAAEAVQLIEMVQSPRCRLILDCSAMAAESAARAELIRRHRKHLAHLHANDPNGQGPGFGQLDFVPIFEALRDIHYRGWASVEVFNYEPGPERLARQSIKYLQRCLGKIAS